MNNTNEQVVLLTGAGGSVGSYLLRFLLDKEYWVAALYRSEKHKESLQQIEQDQPKKMMSVRADLNDFDQAEAAVATVKDRFGHLDLAVNPVGGWIGGKRLHEHSSQEFEKMLSIDFRPAFHLMKAVLPVMVEQHSGKIVNFTSMAAYEDAKKNAVYAASKSAVAKLSEVAAREYGADGVQIFLIAPSTIDTEANRQAMPKADTASWVTPHEIAEAIHFLYKSGDSLSSTVLKLTGEL